MDHLVFSLVIVLPRTCLLKAMFGAARTKEDLADLINVALEEFAKECFELPPFATLDKAAHHVQAMTARGLYRRISQAIPQEARTALDALFVVQDRAHLSGWEQLKQEPASPTLMHLRDLIDHLFVISEQRKLLPPRLFEGLAEGKVKQLHSLPATLTSMAMSTSRTGGSLARMAWRVSRFPSGCTNEIFSFLAGHSALLAIDGQW